MKYKAVIFDLFGTLIDNLSFQEHKSVLMQMASIVSAPPDEFSQMWLDMFNERATGIFKNPETNIEYICQKLGVHVEDTRVKKAAQLRYEYSARSMVPRPYSLDVLSNLRLKGYKTGLITDCSTELTVIWENTPFASLFDVTVFSCIAGMKKPAPQIYQLATNQLGVKPQECLYIGDGSSRELSGAKQVGMNPVLIRALDGPADAYQIEAEEWDGPEISSLKEVMELVE